MNCTHCGLELYDIETLHCGHDDTCEECTIGGDCLECFLSEPKNIGIPVVMLQFNRIGPPVWQVHYNYESTSGVRHPVTAIDRDDAFLKAAEIVLGYRPTSLEEAAELLEKRAGHVGVTKLVEGLRGVLKHREKYGAAAGAIQRYDEVVRYAAGMARVAV